MTTDHETTKTSLAKTEDGVPDIDKPSVALAPVFQGVEFQTMIQAAAVLARSNPRNEQVAYQSLVRSARNPAFASRARYSFPRANTTIVGPTVVLMREAARVWGNLPYGMMVLSDDDETRTIRGWAWDLESNSFRHLDDTFKKLIQRKKKFNRDGKQVEETIWVVPDERDLRELTFRRGAILERNCIRALLPATTVDDVMGVVFDTLEDEAARDPDATLKLVLTAFDKLNVSVDELQEYLGHPIGQSTPGELTQLRGLYSALNENERTWYEVLQERRAERGGTTPSAHASEEQLLGGMKAAPYTPPSGEAKFLSSEQVTAIKDAAQSGGLTPDDLFGILDRMLGTGSKLAEVPMAKYQDILDAIADAATKRRKK